jgi:hypothetical protein
VPRPFGVVVADAPVLQHMEFLQHMEMGEMGVEHMAVEHVLSAVQAQSSVAPQGGLANPLDKVNFAHRASPTTAVARPVSGAAKLVSVVSDIHHPAPPHTG